MRSVLESLLAEKAYMLFLTTICIYWLLTFISNEFVVTDSLLYNTLYGQVPVNYIEKAIAFHHRWAWIGYVILPVVLLLKWVFVSAFIATGAIFQGNSISFKNIFKVVVASEWLFILVGVANTILILFSNVEHLNEMQDLNLISITSIGYLLRGIESLLWLITPLYSINIFQLLYVVMIAAGVGILTQEKARKHFAWVLLSYGMALLIWIVLLTYINLAYA